MFTGKGGYIAPYTTLTVASGAIVQPQSTAGFWAFNLGSSNDFSYYADYWFEVGASYEESDATVSYTGGQFSSAEVITSLTHTKESTKDAEVVSYIAIRNNTLQKITAINYVGMLQLSNSSSTVDYTVASDVNATTEGNEFTINLTNISLYPGESIYICKLTIAKNQVYAGDYSVFLSSSSATVTLEEGSATRADIYFKRDFASGNLSIINGSTTEEGLQITGVTGLIDSAIKWNNSNQFIMQDANDSLAKFRTGQMIHLLSNITQNLSGYGYTNVTIS